MTQIPPRRPPQAASRSRKKPTRLEVPPSGTLPPDAAASADPGVAGAETTDAEATGAAADAASASDQAPAAAATAEASAPEPSLRRKRFREPITEEQRLRNNAALRRKWTERRHLPQGPGHYTWRQNKLIEAYLRLATVKSAALEAGYAPASRGSAAGLFLRRPDVAAIIAARQAEMRRRSEVTTERVIGELAKLAFADPRDLFTPEGKLKPLHMLDDASAASISALEVLAVAGGRRASAGRSRTAGGKAASRAVDAGAADAGATDADSDAAAESGGEGDVVLELRKIKRWDKTKALELLGRYLGLFKDRLELGVSADLASAIEAARKRSLALAAPDASALTDDAVIDGTVIASEVTSGRVVEGKVLDGAMIDESEVEEATAPDER